MKPDNAAELLTQPDVDGALVGGASLDVESFAAICEAAPRGVTFPLVALVVLDGWGLAPPGPGNAVDLARTPVFDELWARYPHTTLDAAGEAVGLPAGQMGNSEVGHLTIGAGRVDRSGSDASEPRDPNRARSSRTRRSSGRSAARTSGAPTSTSSGSSPTAASTLIIDHLRALLEVARRRGDGGPDIRARLHRRPRRVAARGGRATCASWSAEGAQIATVAGRYYAMDRDSRWERTDRALAAICRGEGARATDPVAAVIESYERGVTDEFIEPIVVDGPPRLDGRRRGDLLQLPP